MLAYRLFARVSGHRGERRVHVLDCSGAIGDDDAIRSLLYGRGQACPRDIFTLRTQPLSFGLVSAYRRA
jgi:hypothetical protein